MNQKKLFVDTEFYPKITELIFEPKGIVYVAIQTCKENLYFGEPIKEDKMVLYDIYIHDGQSTLKTIQDEINVFGGKPDEYEFYSVIFEDEDNTFKYELIPYSYIDQNDMNNRCIITQPKINFLTFEG